MKAISYLTTILTLFAARASGQGEFEFNNSASTLVEYLTPSNTVIAAPSNANIRVELFYQPGSNPAPSAILQNIGGLQTIAQGGWETMVHSPTAPVGVPLDGRFATATVESTGIDVVGGASVWLTVIGWTGGFASLQDAVDGGAEFGESNIWEQASGSPPPGAPATITSPFGGEFTGLVVGTPEPSTMIVGGFGAAALLLYRRKLKK